MVVAVLAYYNVEGLYGDDDNAMKAAGHELRGLMCYYNCNMPQLHVRSEVDPGLIFKSCR